MAKKTTPKIETKKTKRLLRVMLTKEELLVAGKTQADKSLELGTLEADRKRTADDFKAKISAIESEVGQLANKVSTGYEYRDVTCTEYLGDPEPDKKRIIRDDTGEEVAIENMTESEMQRELLNADKEDK